jgi:hypothetical protein
MTIRDCRSPISSAGIATTRPASGPATARSNVARRSSESDLILMNAPKVPRANGAGMNTAVWPRRHGGVR